MEIVGIVGDMKQSFDTGSKAEMFIPYSQFPDPMLTGMFLNVALVLRTADDPSALTPLFARPCTRSIQSNRSST